MKSIYKILFSINIISSLYRIERKIIKLLLFLFIISSQCFSQNNNDILGENDSFYYFGINFGKIASNKFFSNENLKNLGWSFSMESWPHFIKIAFENDIEFTYGGTPRFIDGFNSKVLEFNLIYDYLTQIPKVNTV